MRLMISFYRGLSGLARLRAGVLTLDYCVANKQWSANTFAARWRFCSAENEQVRVAGSINRWSKLSSRQLHQRCSSELECDKSQRNKLEMNNR